MQPAPGEDDMIALGPCRDAGNLFPRPRRQFVAPPGRRPFGRVPPAPFQLAEHGHESRIRRHGRHSAATIAGGASPAPSRKVKRWATSRTMP